MRAHALTAQTTAKQTRRASSPMLTLASTRGSTLSKTRAPLEDYAADLRWLEHCRRWALPVAGVIGAVILGVFLWGVTAITEAML